MIKIKVGNLLFTRQAIWRTVFWGFCVGLSVGFALGYMETSGAEFPYLLFTFVNLFLALFFLYMIKKAVRVETSNK